MTTELCTKCRKYKPLDEFYADRNASAHSFVRYDCKECCNKTEKDRRLARKVPALVGSGVRINAGNGVRLVEPSQLVPIDTTLLVEAAVDRDTMSLQEWLNIEQVPSVFVTGRMALILRSAHEGQYAIDLLSLDGDGPKQALTETMCFYVVKLITKREAHTLIGQVYY